MNAVLAPRVIADELDLLAELVPLDGRQVIELGCGAAALARSLLQRHPGSSVTGLEVDERQQSKNRAAPPQPGLRFVDAGAQAIPFEAGSFDLALMLKSLHHVPMPLMAQALGEVARVLRPGGHLYVSEPVFDGPLNEVIRLFHDESVVRTAAQRAVDAAVAGSDWQEVANIRFEMPVHFPDFDAFEQRLMRPTFADHQLTDEKIAVVRKAFEPHLGADGAHFTRPMHVRLLQRQG